MNKNQILQELSYQHCKALYKGGDTHYPNISARDYVNHMFIKKSAKFSWNDFSDLERDHLTWGVKRFRNDLAQGLLDQPEPDEQPEQVAEHDPVQMQIASGQNFVFAVQAHD